MSYVIYHPRNLYSGKLYHDTAGTLFHIHSVRENTIRKNIYRHRYYLSAPSSKPCLYDIQAVAINKTKIKNISISDIVPPQVLEFLNHSDRQDKVLNLSCFQTDRRYYSVCTECTSLQRVYCILNSDILLFRLLAFIVLLVFLTLAAKSVISIFKIGIDCIFYTAFFAFECCGG